MTPYERKGRTAIITLDRPDVRNALDLDTVTRLRDAARHSAQDEGIDVVLLQATGPVFCAGGDINEMVSRQGKSVVTFERHMEGLAQLVADVQSSPKIWVARVQGDAVGAGLGLVLMCDVAVASRDARFGAVFAKVGLVADTGISALLSRSIGLRRTLDLLLTARLIDATTAQQWGLLTRVSDPKALDADVDALLAGIHGLPAATLALLKRQVLQNAAVPVANGLLHEAILQGVAFATPDHVERTRQFMKAKDEGDK